MFPPGPERDDDDGGVVLGAVLQRLGTHGRRQDGVRPRAEPLVLLSDSHLLSDDVGGVCGVLALADDVADLLVAQQEVDAVGGQSQEGVVGVLDLQRQTGQQEYHRTEPRRDAPSEAAESHVESSRVRFGDDAAGLQVEVADAARHSEAPVDVGLAQAVPRHEATEAPDPGHSEANQPGVSDGSLCKQPPEVLTFDLAPL